MRTTIGYKKRSYFLQTLVVFCLAPFLPLTLIYLRVNVSNLPEGITFMILGVYIVGVSILLYMLYLLTTPIPIIEIEHDMMYLYLSEDLKEIPLSKVKEIKAIDTEVHSKHAKLVIQTHEEYYMTEIVKDYQTVCDEIMKHVQRYQRIE